MSYSLVLGVVGAVVGSYFGPGGAQVGFAVGPCIGEVVETRNAEADDDDS